MERKDVKEAGEGKEGQGKRVGMSKSELWRPSVCHGFCCGRLDDLEGPRGRSLSLSRVDLLFFGHFRPRFVPSRQACASGANDVKV